LKNTENKSDNECYRHDSLRTFDGTEFPSLINDDENIEMEKDTIIESDDLVEELRISEMINVKCATTGMKTDVRALLGIK